MLSVKFSNKPGSGRVNDHSEWSLGIMRLSGISTVDSKSQRSSLTMNGKLLDSAGFHWKYTVTKWTAKLTVSGGRYWLNTNTLSIERLKRDCGRESTKINASASSVQRPTELCRPKRDSFVTRRASFVGSPILMACDSAANRTPSIDYRLCIAINRTSSIQHDYSRIPMWPSSGGLAELLPVCH